MIKSCCVDIWVMLVMESKLLHFFRLGKIKNNSISLFLVVGDFKQILIFWYLVIKNFTELILISGVRVWCVWKGKYIVLFFHCLSLGSCKMILFLMWHHILLFIQHHRMFEQKERLMCKISCNLGFLPVKEGVVYPLGKCEWMKSCDHQGGCCALDLLKF